MRFRGVRGRAPSSGPSGFRRWGPSPFRTLSGGCLSLHWQAWRDRGAEPWVVEVLRLGYGVFGKLPSHQMAVAIMCLIGKEIREIHFGHRALPYILCAYKYIQCL